jgi:hypothetical protein
MMRRVSFFLGCALAMIFGPVRAEAGDFSGEQIYRNRCASCHGTAGEGTPENYAKPLAGTRSVVQLAKFIAKTMPEDDPGTCTGEDADKVAAYIHQAFYSKDAQSRSKPRVELARLTVGQYRNVVADLLGSFWGEPGRLSAERGLKARYFKAKRMGFVERVDPEVQFDWGTGPPVPEVLEPHAFTIHWAGSVLAPDTGEYEFVVRTEHALRLWVNDPKKPLIDALVKSGNDTEYRASIYLLGGRAYPIRLEFTKAKQGVDDSKKQKEKPPSKPASIALMWKRPKGVDEVVPRHALATESVPPTFALSTPFPPDDRSLGYERGTRISKEWEGATTEAAIETANYVSAHLRELLGGNDKPAERDRRAREFVHSFAERAFRRPLSDELEKLYVDRHFHKVPDPNLEMAVRRAVLLVLKSPRFLYREVDGKGDAYDVAARLAFTLWDSLPDRPLDQAAASGHLRTAEEVKAQVDRMAADPRTWAKLRQFFLQWLRIEAVPDVAKDPKRYPDFDAAIAADLRTALDLFLEDAAWGPDSDFRRLFLGDTLFLNGRLAAFYGIDLPGDEPFAKVAFQPGLRAGLLTHPYLMAAFSYTDETSPIHRGVFLARNVLGRSLRPPPDAFAPLAAELHPDLTTRERVALQTRPESCNACHGMINPLGFTMEHFDAVGRFRADEHGRPINAEGGYQARSGETLTFQGARELADFLAQSDEVQATFVERLFQYLVKQPIRAYRLNQAESLRQTFVANGFNIRKLVVDIARKSCATEDTDSTNTEKKVEKTQ